MAKFAHIQNSFKSGLLSKKLEGRTDIEEYRNGCLQLKNMTVMEAGGASKRPGSYFLENVSSLEAPDGFSSPTDRSFPASADKFAIIPFQFSRTESNILMFHTESKSNIAKSSNASLIVFSSDGTPHFSVSPEGEDLLRHESEDLDPLGYRYTQVGDILIIVHESGILAPVIIKRIEILGGNAFNVIRYQQEARVSGLGLQNSTPEGSTNFDPDKVLKFNNTSPFTVTAEDSSGSAISFFTSSMVTSSTEFASDSEVYNSYFTVNYSGGNYAFRVDKVNSASEAEVTLYSSAGGATLDGEASDDWWEKPWNERLGFPRTITTYQERLVFGGNRSFPDSLWFSQLGNLFIMSRQSTSSLTQFDPTSVNLGSSTLNGITWMSSNRNLLVGTEGAEYAILPPPESGGIDARFSPYIRPQTSNGSKNTIITTTDNFTIYVSRDGKHVRDFTYSENNGSNVSRNLSVLSDDLVFSGFSSGNYSSIEIKKVILQQSTSTIWSLTSLGKLLGLTLSKSGGTLAWHEHDISGFIEDVVSIPKPDGTGDNLFLIVTREINGSTERYFERLGPRFEHPLLTNSSTEISDKPIYSDSALRLTSGTATTSFSGLDHLEGEEVQVLADGKIQSPKTVSGGSITIDTAAEEVIVGLKYSSVLETMPLEAGAIIGNSQILLKRVDQIIMKLYKSLGGEYYFEDDSYDIEYDVDENETFTGISRVDYASTNSYRYTVKVKHEDPTPFNLLAMVFRGFTKD